jgi:arginyl-tRNA synthetase
MSINEFLKLKEQYFQETTAQRRSLSNEICEANVKLLTLCSITFDLLKVSHSSDIRLNTNNFVNEHDSSFLLYNCARISTILKKFNYLVAQGIYPNLPEIETVNFEEDLKNELEKRLCNEFLFKFEDQLKELKSNLIDNSANLVEKLQIKFNIHKLCRFLFDFSKLFSSYYSKVKVLEVSKKLFIF